MKIVKRNYFLKTFLIVFATVGAAFLNFVLQIMYTKKLSIEDYGRLSLYLNFIMIMMPLVGAGLHNFWIKIHSKDSNEFVFWLPPSFNYLKLTLFFSFFIQAIFCIIYVGKETHIYALLSSFILAQLSIDLINSLNIISRKIGEYIFWRCFSPVIRIILFSIVLVFSEITLFKIGLIYLISAIFPVFFLLKKMRSEKKVFTKNKYKYSALDVFKNCWAYSVAGVLYLIYLQSNVLFISYFYTDKEVGIFNIPILMIMVVLMFPTIIFQKVFAVELNQSFYRNKESFKVFFRKSNRIMLGLGVLASLLFYFLSPVVIDIFFGETYSQSKYIASILALLIPFAFLTSSLSAAHIKKIDLYTKVGIMLCVAIVHIILSVLLQEYGGMEVFAFITVISYFLVSILFFISSKKIIARMN